MKKIKMTRTLHYRSVASTDSSSDDTRDDFLFSKLSSGIKALIFLVGDGKEGGGKNSSVFVDLIYIVV